VDKPYFIINQCAANVTVTPTGGTGAVVRAGTSAWWYCDGTDGFVADPSLDQIRAAAGNVPLGGFKLTGVANPTSAQDGATKAYVDGGIATSEARPLNTLTAPTGPLSLNAQKITNLATPTIATDAATFGFVQSELAAAATLNLPPVTGQAGKYLTNNGTVASWDDVTAVLYVTYDNRGDLRTIDGPADTMALVEGLGLFVWVSGSDQPDDDETAFASATGVWLVEAASYDLAFSSWLPEVDGLRTDVDGLRTDVDGLLGNPTIILGTATCSLSSVSTVQGANFTATITGAAVGDPVSVNPPDALETSTTGRLTHHAWVSAADTVTIRIVNPSAATGTLNAAVTGASNPWRVAVFKGVA
jgi:hypothetical protein